MIATYSHSKCDGGWLMNFLFSPHSDPSHSSAEAIKDFRAECVKRGYDPDTLTINLKGPKINPVER